MDVRKMRNELPVSYTHLDVYKRQAQMVAYTTSTTHMEYSNAEYKYQKENYPCLLYTSLLCGFCADDFSMKQKSLQVIERYGNYYVEW